MQATRRAFACVLFLVTVVLGAAGITGAASAQDRYDPRSNYLKSELMIPMRDGVELFTQIYEPTNGQTDLPILLLRTPYGIGDYGPTMNRAVLGPSTHFAPEGYVFVYQDVRGKFRSEGEFEVMRPVYTELGDPKAVDETTDTYDTIDWLIENLPDHNGRVGMWGISYPGFQVVMGMINAHPAFVAASPQASPADMFLGDDFHHNGAFRLMYTFGWLSNYAATRSGQSESHESASFDWGTDNGYEFFLDLGPVVNADRRYFHERVPTWNEYMQHGTYDAYWQRQEVLQHMHDIGPAVLNVAGWFDAEDFYGPLRIYDAIEANDADNQSLLVVGPWQHGGWAGSNGRGLGAADFGSDTGTFYREEIEFRWFEALLRGDGGHGLPEAMVFETGANEWRRHDAWPPADVVEANLYLGADGSLSFEAPGSEAAFDEFVSDPADPVPFSATPGIYQGHTWMVEDQQFAGARDDVLVYRTRPLEEDVVIAGQIVASLATETTGTDADWIVKLIDESPDGSFHMLLAGEVFRAKFRNSFEEPEPLVAGEITPIEFFLGDKYHRFKKGHRIQVQIQSTWFPVIDRNPQTFCDIYHAEEEDFHAATHRVHRAEGRASHLALRRLPAEAAR